MINNSHKYWAKTTHHCINSAQRFTFCDLLSFVNFVGKFTANNSLIIYYTISYNKMLHSDNKYTR